MIKCLLVSALSFFLAADPTHPTQKSGDSDTPVVIDQKCQDMGLEIEVAPATEAGAIISLTLPSDADIKVFLMASDNDGPPSEAKVVNGQLRNIPRGSYEIFVQDQRKKYCLEHRKVTVD